jgi:hypothetical protein
MNDSDVTHRNELVKKQFLFTHQLKTKKTHQRLDPHTKREQILLFLTKRPMIIEPPHQSGSRPKAVTPDDN